MEQASDHCETPTSAYADIVGIVSEVATLLNKSDENVIIYDPYFCAGSMKRHLHALGFKNVINENRDFYEDIRQGTIPRYDILITNPPYSTEPYNHIKRLLRFVADARKPYFILQPVYVYTKPYYVSSREQLGEGCFFITPSHRYHFNTPLHVQRKTGRQHVTSPFVSLWYVFAPSCIYAALRKWWCSLGHKTCNGALFRAQSRHLPQRFKDTHDPTRRRRSLKQRKAHAKRVAANRQLAVRNANP
eukprot:gene5460-7162_t